MPSLGGPLSDWVGPVCEDCWKANHATKPLSQRLRSDRLVLGVPEPCFYCDVRIDEGVYARMTDTPREQLALANLERTLRRLAKRS